MKIRLFFVLLLGLITAVGFIGCEGEIGPQGIQGTAGPQGPQGVPGNDGSPGADGADGQGTQDCMQCHGSNQLITAKVYQWENSIHALGGHNERNTGSCSGCHTSQGFLARVASGEGPDFSMTIDDPLPQNCYTCHQVHSTYTDADWAFTAADPVDIWITGQTEDIGTGNQCLNCHQPRIPGDGVPALDATGDYTIESSRYGPHHGAQGTMFLGIGKSGAYEIGDGYENGAHTALIDNACVTCHMATVADGRASGGHTFRVESEDGELNPAGCVQCHPDEDALEMTVANTQSEIQALLDELGAMLETKGIKRAGQDRSEPGTYDAVTVGAYYNYIFVVEDQSMGVHNGKYTRTLLQNSIAAIQ